MYARLAPPVNTVALRQLQRAHATIRATLQQVTSTLSGGSPYLSDDGVRIQQEARQLCVVLARQLRAHMRHEEQLATRCSLALGRMGPEELARLALEHHVDQERLRIINQSLAYEGNGRLTYVGPLLISLIAGLQRQMAAQEVDLFPFLERVLAVDRHSNEATRMEGSYDVEPEGAWKPSVACRASAVSVVNAP